MAQLTPQTSAKVSSLCNSYSIVVKHDNQGQIVEMPLSEQDLDADHWAHDDSCTRIAWVAVKDALKSMPGELFARVMDANLSIFQRGEGAVLFARAEEVFSTKDHATLRAKVFRTADRGTLASSDCIAEYTVQARFVSGEHLAEEAPVEEVVYSQPRATDAEMKTMTSKEQAMEIRRRKIFDGACEVIGREGYAATTIRKVAKAAGVPISTMYQYIDTKEDLLFMITSSCMEEIFEYMTEELKREGDAVTKMTHAVNAYMQYVSKNRRYINLAYRETRALSRANREKIFDIERRFTRLWEEIIINGNKSNDFRAEKSRLAANMVYFFCNVWSLRYWSIQDYTEAEVREYLMKFVMGGLTSPDSL